MPIIICSVGPGRSPVHHLLRAQTRIPNRVHSKRRGWVVGGWGGGGAGQETRTSSKRRYRVSYSVHHPVAVADDGRRRRRGRRERDYFYSNIYGYAYVHTSTSYTYSCTYNACVLYCTVPYCHGRLLVYLFYVLVFYTSTMCITRVGCLDACAAGTISVNINYSRARHVDG